MYVTKIEPVTKAKYKVFLDEQFAFVLYKGELSRYKIQEDAHLSEDTIQEIKKEILEKRAKLRAMHLLERMDRTEAELYDKLKRDLYPEDIIEIAMRYVKSFGYLGDVGYAKRFVESRQGSKSKLEIKMSLLQKGVSKEIISEVLEVYYHEQDESAAIQKLLEKKRFMAETATEEEKRKIYGYLMRKGFSYEDVRRAIRDRQLDG
jgi:regulatory protein